MFRSKYLLIITMLSCAILMWGCTETQKATALSGGALAVGLKQSDNLLQSGVVQEVLGSVAMTDADKKSVDDAFAQLQSIRNSVKNISANPEKVIEIALTIASYHDDTVDNIGILKAAADEYWGSFSGSEKVKLKRWYKQVADNEPRYQAFIEAVYSGISSDARKQMIYEALKVVSLLVII